MDPYEFGLGETIGRRADAQAGEHYATACNTK
jgi:hypothetical protein